MIVLFFEAQQDAGEYRPRIIGRGGKFDLRHHLREADARPGRPQSHLPTAGVLGKFVGADTVDRGVIAAALQVRSVRSPSTLSCTVSLGSVLTNSEKSRASTVSLPGCSTLAEIEVLMPISRLVAESSRRSFSAERRHCPAPGAPSWLQLLWTPD